MRFYQIRNKSPTLVVETENGMFDLTSANNNISSLTKLLRESKQNDRHLSGFTKQLIPDTTKLLPDDVFARLEIPCRPAEVWGAGVTYEISEQARESESIMPDMYMNVYNAERPEIFFKATSSRIVGPNQAIGIRYDSEWDVPEPELGLVLYEGQIIGYTIGNDVSSRSIEGANPLYLPQAKMYMKSCAIGPSIVTADGIDPQDLKMSMKISRNNEVIFEGSSSTNQLKRSFDELVEYCLRCDAVPELMILLTGTSIVPDEGVSLMEGDDVAIHIDEIGTLRNHAVTV
jgi:2-dehydro-3-deoxy-D-arabinonate dehydratase